MRVDLLGLYAPNNSVVKTAARERMIELVKELIKANYCKYILHNDMMSDKQYQNKMQDLRRIESIYPDMAMWYSPTRDNGYNETSALEVYGSDKWSTLKRTLELTRPGVMMPKYSCHDFGEG